MEDDHQATHLISDWQYFMSFWCIQNLDESYVFDPRLSYTGFGVIVHKSLAIKTGRKRNKNREGGANRSELREDP